MDLLTILPYIWGIGGILLIISEFFMPGFVVFFFGVGALLNALLLVLIPPLRNNLLLQIMVWLAASSLLLFTLRRVFSKVFKGRTAAAKDEFSGQKAEVIEDIAPEKPGRIRFQGTSWKAISYDEYLQVGDSVEILKKENLTLVITRSILDEPVD
jgi:membrane protein implicated in regulation of membrane protease activity